jgi:hypothetical protein
MPDVEDAQAEEGGRGGSEVIADEEDAVEGDGEGADVEEEGEEGYAEGDDVGELSEWQAVGPISQQAVYAVSELEQVQSSPPSTFFSPSTPSNVPQTAGSCSDHFPKARVQKQEQFQFFDKQLVLDTLRDYPHLRELG